MMKFLMNVYAKLRLVKKSPMMMITVIFPKILLPNMLPLFNFLIHKESLLNMLFKTLVLLPLTY